MPSDENEPTLRLLGGRAGRPRRTTVVEPQQGNARIVTKRLDAKVDQSRHDWRPTVRRVIVLSILALIIVMLGLLFVPDLTLIVLETLLIIVLLICGSFAGMILARSQVHFKLRDHLEKTVFVIGCSVALPVTLIVFSGSRTVRSISSPLFKRDLVQVLLVLLGMFVIVSSGYVVIRLILVGAGWPVLLAVLIVAFCCGVVIAGWVSTQFVLHKIAARRRRKGQAKGGEAEDEQGEELFHLIGP